MSTPERYYNSSAEYYTTAADRQPDGKKGRLKIDLGPSLADASEGVQAEGSARKPRRKGMKRAPKK
jgi:hypothetical protein